MTWSLAACSARVGVFKSVNIVDASATDDSDGVVL